MVIAEVLLALKAPHGAGWRKGGTSHSETKVFYSAIFFFIRGDLPGCPLLFLVLSGVTYISLRDAARKRTAAGLIRVSYFRVSEPTIITCSRTFAARITIMTWSSVVLRSLMLSIWSQRGSFVLPASVTFAIKSV